MILPQDRAPGESQPPAGGTPLFPMGQLVATPGALEALNHADIQTALRRHLTGDWGDLGAEDKRSNDEALRLGDRLFSAYQGANGTKFWIITEWDRSLTTVLLPSEY
jgi:hypothetical protein